MQNFVAIDFETANQHPSSVCSVGIIVVKDGVMVDHFYSLIRPYPDFYAWFCQRVHGLGPDDTCFSDTFPEVWAQAIQLIRKYFPYINDGEVPFVAHNAHFDEGCLRSAFKAYQIFYPDYPFLDTLKASRQVFGNLLENHQLHTVARACGYDLTNHHHALADAEACAAIAIKIIDETQL